MIPDEKSGILDIPNVCPKCGCSKSKKTNIDTMDYLELEYDIVCYDCGELLAHFAFGYYETAASEKRIEDYENRIRNTRDASFS